MLLIAPRGISVPAPSKVPVTMRDVAEAAGVSRMTVSRALKPNSSVSEATRERILKVVHELNYVPDQMAGSLSSKRSGFVAVLVPSLNNLHFAETIQALTEELEKIGQQLLLGHTDYSAEREEKIVEAMLRRRPEALLLSYDGHTDRTLSLLSNANIPVIELWERPEDPIDHTIGFSNEEAAYKMAIALVEAGYRNLTFLAEAEDDWTRGAARRRGFCRAMKDAGLADDQIIQVGRPPLSIDDGAAAASELRTRFRDTDCVFCVSDLPAFGLLSALKAEGLKVPEDIGIAGFGNFEVSRFSQPSITTVVVDPKRIGVEAGQLIGQLLAEPSSAKKRTQIFVEADLDFRGSTKPRAS